MSERSPFDPRDWPSHGLINSSHVTNLTMVYPEGALPTPWPWVVYSLTLSVMLGSISVYTSVTKLRQSRNLHLSPEKSHWYSEARNLAIVAGIGVTISAVRSIASFALSIRIALKHGSPAAPSALLVLMASLHISIANLSLQPVFVYLVKTAFLFAWVASIVNMYGAVGSTFYSDGNVVGGHCAYPHDDCVDYVTGKTSYLTLEPMDYGCPMGSPALQGAHPPNNNIRIAEISFAGVSAFYGFVVFLYHPDMLRFLISPLDLAKMLKRSTLVSFWREWWVIPVDADLDDIAEQTWIARVYPRRSPRTLLVVSQGLALVIVVVVCCVAIPMHVLAEVRPTGDIYIDGSPIEMGIGPPAWTDCFDVKAPVGKVGFWSFWWEMKAGWVSRVIAVV